MTEDAETTWRRRVARWKASGETASAFGAREGIKASTLRWWSSVLQREPTSAPVRMVQLVRIQKVLALLHRTRLSRWHTAWCGIRRCQRSLRFDVSAVLLVWTE